MPLTLVAVLLAGGCETVSEDGGLGDFGRTILGDVVNTAAATASVEMVRETADSVCDADDDMCRDLTMVTMSGFSETFIRKLSEGDVRRINEAREASIRSGETEEWSNPETGASGRIRSEPAPPQPPQPTPVKVKRDRLESLPMMNAVGQPYTVIRGGGANVRGGPGVGYQVVETLGTGEKVTAIARVQDQPWFLVGRDDVGIGYVFEAALAPWSEPAEPAPAEAPAPEPQPEPAPAEVAEVEVEMASECFTTTQTVTLAGGETEQAEITSCRTPNGWAQV